MNVTHGSSRRCRLHFRIALSSASSPPPSTPLQHDSVMPHIESSMTQSQEPPRPSEEGQTPEPDGADWRQKAAENLAGVYKAKINPQEVENSTPRNQKERDSTAFRAAVKQMEEVLREALEKQDQEIQAMSDEHTRAKDDLAGTKDELAQTKDELARIKSELARTKHNLARTEVELAQTKGLLAARSVELAQTKELLAARSVELVQTTELLAARTVELVKVQPFLSTMDRISEAEVLGIVRDLNDNIIQIAANLTEGWGKLQSPRSNKAPPNKKELDALSQFYGPTLVRRVLNQDPSAVALLVRSILCYIVTQITLSWRRDHDQRSWILGSIYRRLSASGKHTPHAAIEAILTNTRGTGNLGQMEGLGPKLPPQTINSLHLNR